MKNYLISGLLTVGLLAITSCGNQEVERLQTEVRLKSEQLDQVQNQLDAMTRTNTSLLDRMEDLSVISTEGATSIRESLESINSQTGYIQEMGRALDRKDSLNLSLVMNLKRSLDDISDDDVQVDVRGGKVHVSISDQLLFGSGSARINARAEEVLGKVASVLNDHSQLNVMVEGHTDNVPIDNTRFNDNWDLSTQRATSVVRKLVNEFYVDPARLTAAGRAEFDPRGDNNSTDGRARNRRTEIVILPGLDEFFELLESPTSPG
ncbi:MAG: OmpA family protein [Bacteroidota bacterium]